ncbi:glycosyltransferase family 39 protein [Candidatus Woesearchaeota archaeon]|nr:glycosyltransferase family 39 protein [Candidatus Woesearchaeota archaeon]
MASEKSAILIITLLSIILSLPFISKPYHVDDTPFMYVAEQITKDPLRPYSFNFEWSSQSGQASHIDDTPLVSYYAALIFVLFGKSEITVHLSFIIFKILAGISFYFLAKKFLINALIPTLIMVSTPTYLVMSHNIMPDVPMISMFLLATALFIYGTDKSNHKLMFLGGFAAGLAYLTKPNAIVIIPLLALYAILKKKPRYTAYTLVPIAMITLFSIHNYFFQNDVLILGYIPFLFQLKQSAGGMEIYVAYFIANLSYIGGATIFTFFFLYPFLYKKRNWMLLAACVSITVVMAFLLYQVSENFISGQYTIPQLMMFTVFVASSAFFILAVIAEYCNKITPCIKSTLSFRNSRCDSNTFFLLIWFFGVYIFNSGFISGGSVKYNTLFLPPLVLVYMKLFDKYAERYKLKKIPILLIMLFATMATGIVVALADFNFATVYKDFAYNVADKYKSSNNTVWFLGHYGFQYYMENKNYKVLLIGSNEPKKGDIIAKARIPSPRKMISELKKRTVLLETVSYDGSLPIRTQNGRAHAGFYTYGGGFLPYSISDAKLENFDIYLVVTDH